MNVFYSESELTWSNEPVFGLVHPEGCSACSHYMLHVAAAHRSRDPSFAQAMRDRDTRPNYLYLDGMCRGDSLSRGLDIEARQQLAVCQLQLRDAMGLASARQEQLVAVRAELKWVKQQYDDLLQFVDSLDFPEAGEALEFKPDSDGRDDVICGEVGKVDGDSEGGKVKDEVPHTPPASIKRELAALPTPPTTPGREILEYEATSSKDAGSSTPSQATVGLPRLESSAPPSTAPKVDATICPEVASEIPPPKKRNSITYPPTPSPEVQEISLPDTEGSTAEKTVSIAQPPQPAKKIVVSTPSYEIFVDSSGWGIGFVLNGRWLAWPLKSDRNTEGRDNNWAEMVAVELGIRILISAGIYSKTILIRSDNIGVVQALKTGRTKHVQQKVVLETIMDLCQGSDIGIVVKWVDTKSNVADKPSRGIFPSKALLFPTQLEVPPHLEPFLRPRVT